MPSKVLMTAKQYHAAEGIGSTLLKAASTKTLIHALETPFEDTAASIIGGGLHDKTLTPEYFSNNYIVAPKVDRRTKAGKETWAAFEEMAGDKTILNEEQMEAINGMKNSIFQHVSASAMLKGGEAEFAYFATCPETGLILKCRPDYVNKGALIDLKSARDASLKGFSKAAVNLAYHVQAAFYLDVYNLATGQDLREFYFIVAENTAPYGCAVYKLGDEEIDYGRMLYKNALKNLKQYLDEKGQSQVSRQKYLYGEDIKTLTFPNWAFGA